MARFKVVLSGVDTGKLKVLKAQETAELIRLFQESGDDQYVNQAVEGNLKLVLAAVQKFSERYDNLDDLFQIGTIGLIKAVRNFSLEQNVRFSTYAVPMILGEIKRFLRDATPLRISRQLKDVAYRALKAKEEFLRQHGREPGSEELANVLQVSNFQLREALDAVQQVYSLSDPVFTDDNDSYSYYEKLTDNNQEAEKITNLLTLKKGMKLLTPTQRKVVEDRYYLDKTQSEIAKEFGISQAQVSRIEKNAIEVLRGLF